MNTYLLTSTTYGTWLPGDPRGSVTSVRDYRSSDPPTKHRVEHDRPGEAWEPEIPGLYHSSLSLMKQRPVWLTPDEAASVMASFCRTAELRGWRLMAGVVMRNHFHLVVDFRQAVRVDRILTDFKSHATRALREANPEEHREKWWTRGGSRRFLKDEQAVRSAVHYVLHKQPGVLAQWSLDAS